MKSGPLFWLKKKSDHLSLLFLSFTQDIRVFKRQTDSLPVQGLPGCPGYHTQQQGRWMSTEMKQGRHFRALPPRDR